MTHASTPSTHSAKAAGSPPPEQATLRITRATHEPLKVVASLERRSLIEQTEVIFAEFFRKYDELVRGVAQDQGDLPAPVEWSGPTTTVRVPRSLQEKVKEIATMERRSIMDLTEAVFSRFLGLYEVMSGMTLTHRDAAVLPSATRHAG